MIKKILIALGIILIIIQFFRPEKNESNDLTYDISTKYSVPEDVNQILKVSCNDCHSNKTVYPWYSNVQPVAWWLNDHVIDGKRHLNFSTFAKMPLAFQNHKLEETIDMVKKKEMPLSEYTYFGLHKEADLTDAQRETLITWAEDQMTYLKNTYPADSLKMPKRPGPPPAN